MCVCMWFSGCVVVCGTSMVSLHIHTHPHTSSFIIIVFCARALAMMNVVRYYAFLRAQIDELNEYAFTQRGTREQSRVRAKYKHIIECCPAARAQFHCRRVCALVLCMFYSKQIHNRQRAGELTQACTAMNGHTGV